MSLLYVVGCMHICLYTTLRVSIFSSVYVHNFTAQRCWKIWTAGELLILYFHPYGYIFRWCVPSRLPPLEGGIWISPVEQCPWERSALCWYFLNSEDFTWRVRDILYFKISRTRPSSLLPEDTFLNTNIQPHRCHLALSSSPWSHLNLLSHQSSEPLKLSSCASEVPVSSRWWKTTMYLMPILTITLLHFLSRVWVLQTERKTSKRSKFPLLNYLFIVPSKQTFVSNKVSFPCPSSVVVDFALLAVLSSVLSSCTVPLSCSIETVTLFLRVQM